MNDNKAEQIRRAARMLLARRVSAATPKAKSTSTSYTRLKKRHLQAVTALAMVAIFATQPAEAFKKGAVKRTIIRYGFAIPAAAAGAFVGGTIGALGGSGASLLVLKRATDPKPEPIVIQETAVQDQAK